MELYSFLLYQDVQAYQAKKKRQKLIMVVIHQVMKVLLKNILNIRLKIRIQ